MIMKVNIDYVSTKWYHDAPDGLRQWAFYFKRYSGVRGFILRVFGVHVNIRENGATDKLIAKCVASWRSKK